MNVPQIMLAVLLSGTVMVAAGKAQTESAGKGPRGRPQMETCVYQAGNLDLGETVDSLRQIFNLKSVSAIDRTNCIVVRADRRTLEEIDGLLKQLHSQDPVASDQVNRVIELQHRDPRYVQAALGGLYRSVALEAVRNSSNLVLWGPTGDVAKLEALIRELDTPAAAAQGTSDKPLAITVNFIQASAGAAQQGRLPDHLKDVQEALVHSGVGDLKLFGHLMARVREGHEFLSEGFVTMAGQTPGGSRPVSTIRVQGRAELSRPKVAELEIAAELEAEVGVQMSKDLSGSDVASARVQDFSFRTSATVPLGDYVVLGAMPTRLEDSDTILLVIRVTAD